MAISIVASLSYGQGTSVDLQEELLEALEKENVGIKDAEFIISNKDNLPQIAGELLMNAEPQDSLTEKIFNTSSDFLNISLEACDIMGDVLYSLAEKLNDQKLLGRANLIKGLAQGDLGNLEVGLEHLFLALDIIDPKLDPKAYGNTINNIAGIYLMSEDYEKAIEYYKLTQDFARANNDQFLLLKGIQNVAVPLTFIDEYDSAIVYLNKALMLARELDETLLEAYALGNLASIYFEQNEFKKALKYQLEGIALEAKIEDFLGMIDSHGVLARCYSVLGDHQKADYHFQQSYDLAIQVNAPNKLLNLYEAQGEVYSQRGEYEKAFGYAVLYNKLYDSLLNAERNAQMVEMREKYETDQKEAAIQELQIREQLAKNRNTILVITSLLFLIATISGFLLFFQIRKRKREADERNALVTSINKKLSDSQDELLALNKTKDQFFAVIAHDLRGPITSFQGIGKLIEYTLQKGGEDKLQELITSIDNSAQGVSTLLDNLLKWSLSQTGTLAFKGDSLNLTQLISDIADIYASTSQSKGVELNILIDKDLWVYGDRNMLSTVLRNLIGNALKFTPHDGCITVVHRVENNHLTIEVCDSGIGIPEEKLDKIFDLSENKSTLGTQGEKGTGLGLMLCKEFIEAHGGTINITSKPGNGTSISFSLPMEEAHEPKPSTTVLEEV
ncbi:ATP-binding protein [Roseivirga sp. E12]|uniref:tetratricopeptide repeat-containing sensor histidine kinase n=1 Tax=Roseivirga sp. E12 TaxID=2819237 RepID=UPI001ABC1F96|nr:ATP-binding protein [Roseivirga sp. E12]MBO3697335.1 tetratricopeptide repeat-containing sensor histidine kinase [Roseivirga sp. E12]